MGAKAGKRKGLNLALITVFCLCLVQSVFSQDKEDIVSALMNIHPSSALSNTGLTVFPILYFPVGGEQQAMGMAYTGVARDVSFIEANPAGSPLLANSEVSVFHAEPFRTVNLESIAYTQRWGDLGFASFFRLLHTDFGAVGIRGEQLAASSYTESLLGVNLGYTFLRNFYFSGISIGANLKLAYRNIPEELYQHVTGLNGTDQSAIGFMADIGALTRFNLAKFYTSRDKNFSIGVSLKNVGPLVIDDPLPTTFSAGIGYSPFRFLLISGDFNLPINLKDLTQSEQAGFAVGMALQFVDFFSLRAGFQLRGDNPRFSLGSNVDLQYVSLDINYSVDASTEFKIPDHLSIQAKLNLGDSGRAVLAKKVDDLYIDALVALAASDFKKVIDLCKQALSIDPSYTPAKETLDLATTSQALLNQIESIRIQEPQSDVQ